jgi:protein translocase SecG subunit
MLTFLYILFFIVCVILIAVVLLQSSRAAGMGIFGSSSSQTPFGSRSGDVLAKFTTIIAIIFMVGAFGLAVYQSK